MRSELNDISHRHNGHLKSLNCVNGSAVLRLLSWFTSWLSSSFFSSGSPALSRPPCSSRGSSTTRSATGASTCTGVQSQQREASHPGISSSRGQAAERPQQSRGRGARASHSRQVRVRLQDRGRTRSARGSQRATTSWSTSPPRKRARERMLSLRVSRDLCVLGWSASQA